MKTIKAGEWINLSPVDKIFSHGDWKFLNLHSAAKVAPSKVLCQRKWLPRLSLIHPGFHICLHLFANKSFIQYYLRSELVQ